MIIFRFINSVVKEEFFNPIFCKQRAAKDSHDLHNRAIEFEVMFDDSDKTVGNDGHMDLDADGILRFAPKGLDSEVLLNPFEEELDLPSVAIQECDIPGREVEVIGVVGKGSLQFRSIVDDSPEFRRIVGTVVLPDEADCLVSDDIVLSLKEVFSRDNLMCWMPLLTNNKECTRKIDAKESRKVKVPSIKHITGKRLVCEPVHGVDIVDVGIGDSIENWNLRNDVMNNLSVDCDCNPNPKQAQIQDVGILASTDPVAVDQACLDIIFNMPTDSLNNPEPLIKRIHKKHGPHTVDHAAKIGLGTKRYKIILID